jgi:hypothetical protein
MGAEPAAAIPWDDLEQVDADGGLLPAYAGVMRRPLEYFGISIWSGPEEGGGYMGALGDPSVIKAGGVNVFAETEVVETLDDYRELAELGVNFLPFTHTLFSPTGDQRGFYVYDKVKEVIGFLEERDVPVSAYFGLANHPGFPIFTLDYAREAPARLQRNAEGRDVYRVFPMRTVLNPALSWEHPDLARGAVESAAYHAADWRSFSNVPFWCLMGENLFAEEEGDFSEAHRRHFAAWLERRYGSEAELAKAWGLDGPIHFADVGSPSAVRSPTPTAKEIDAARFRRASMAEIYRAVRAAVRSSDPRRTALGLFHGSADRPKELVRMGVHPDRIAAMTDGIASSHILWPNTQDPRNLVNLALFRSFGKPVVVPIFGLEQDRVINDFTSANYKVERIARRTYEHLGMGVWGLAVGYWKSWGWTLAHHDAGKREIARLAAELKRLGPELDWMQPVPFRVGFVVTADDAALSGIPPEYLPLFTAALERGLPVEFVYEERLLSNRPPVPPVLVVAAAKGLSERGAERIRAHVRQGGSVLAWPTGDDDWVPRRRTANRRIRALKRAARPAPSETVDWLVRQGGSAAVPAEYGPGCAGLETFALCDGVNGLIVAINASDRTMEDASFTIGQHVAARPLRWAARVGEGASIDGSRIKLTLGPQETAVLLGEAVVPRQWDLASELARLESRLASAKDRRFDTAISREVLGSARSHLAAGRRGKALAGLLRTRRTLLVDLQIQPGDDAAEIRVRIASLGRPLPEITAVEIRLPDHGDVRMQLDKTSKSQWTGMLRRDERLAVYDYDAGHYSSDTGPIAVQAEARAGAYAGASSVILWPSARSQ